MIYLAFLLTVVALICLVEVLTAGPPKPEPHSLDCRDGIADPNCYGRSHLTREEVELLNSLDGQLGITEGK